MSVQRQMTEKAEITPARCGRADPHDAHLHREITGDVECHGLRASAARARIARYELPGVRWYFAACEACRWLDMSWRDKGWAQIARDKHNLERHPR